MGKTGEIKEGFNHVANNERGEFDHILRHNIISEFGVTLR